MLTGEFVELTPRQRVDHMLPGGCMTVPMQGRRLDSIKQGFSAPKRTATCWGSIPVPLSLRNITRRISGLERGYRDYLIYAHDY